VAAGFDVPENDAFHEAKVNAIKLPEWLKLIANQVKLSLRGCRQDASGGSLGGCRFNQEAPRCARRRPFPGWLGKRGPRAGGGQSPRAQLSLG